MTPVWMPSPNFWPGRKGHSMAVAPSYIVLHTTVGTKEAAAARFLDPNSQVSAHYIVGLDGSVTQMVSEANAAWHAGTEAMNLDSIGIEHEDGGDFNGPRPDALYAASAALVRAIVGRYPGALAIDTQHVIPHRQVVATACPDALDVARIIRQAQTGGGFQMDQEVNDALRKIGLTATVAALGAAMDDAALGSSWPVVSPDLSNLGSVAASYAKSHPGPGRPPAVSGGGSLVVSLTGTATPK
jgi:N-acetylmuramoyl-L-alanine amidase-like protein